MQIIELNVFRSNYSRLRKNSKFFGNIDQNCVYLFTTSIVHLPKVHNEKDNIVLSDMTISWLIHSICLQHLICTKFWHLNKKELGYKLQLFNQ